MCCGEDGCPKADESGTVADAQAQAFNNIQWYGYGGNYCPKCPHCTKCPTCGKDGYVPPSPYIVPTPSAPYTPPTVYPYWQSPYLITWNGNTTYAAGTVTPTVTYQNKYL